MELNRLAILTGACLVALSGCSKETEQDCIINGLKGINDKIVAAKIENACVDKYRVAAPPLPSPTKMPDSATSKLTGRAGTSFKKISLSLHNGNDNWRVREVTIWALPSDKKDAPDAASYTRTYKVPILLEPLTASAATIETTESGDAISWGILTAEGNPIK